MYFNITLAQAEAEAAPFFSRGSERQREGTVWKLLKNARCTVLFTDLAGLRMLGQIREANKPTSASPDSSVRSTSILIDTAECGQGVGLMMVL